jgi:hypothetical protein
MMVGPATASEAAAGEAREGPGEVLLRDAMAREAKAPRGRMAVVAQLSRLPPPGARPHHRRVVRTLMEECARRHDGTALVLRSGDMVLVAGGAPARVGGPADLPGLLARLLHLEDADAAGVVAAFPLADGVGRLAAMLAQGGVAEAPEPPMRPTMALPDVSDRQVAAMLRLGIVARLRRPGETGVQIRPVHRAVALVPHLLVAIAPEAAGLAADPWLRLHLAAGLDAALLRGVRAAWGTGGPLDAAPRTGVAKLLLPVGLQAVLSAPFLALAGQAGPALCVAVPIAEACAAPAMLATARERLARFGVALVLDRLDPHALVATRPEALGADMLRVAWAPALLRWPEPAQAALHAAVARIGAERIVLTGADTEAAIGWGRAAGLCLFEGRHVDSMLAATRLLACPHAAQCGLLACAERAAGTQPAGRAGCRNPGLLDQATPFATLARAA